MKNKLHHYFFFQSQNITKKEIVLYTFFVYLFGLLVRLLLLYQSGQIGPLWSWGNPVAVWTPDAGRYGFYAKEVLSGVALPFRDDYLLGYLLAFISKSLHLSLDWVMVLFPAFVAPLIAFPIVIIGSSIRQPILGVLSAFVAVSGTFFYLRSHIGYVDTDTLNLFLLLLSIALIIKSAEQKSLLYGFLGAVMMALFGWWYHSATIINLLVLLVTVLYVLLYAKRERSMLVTTALLAISVVPLVISLKFFLLLVTFALFSFIGMSRRIDHRFYWVLFAVGAVAAFFMLHPEHYFHRAVTYFSSGDIKSFTAGGIRYYYLDDLQFVGEVSKVGLWNAYAPLFISVLYVIAATIGYIMMLIGYPLMLLTLPMIILGYLSGFAGARFAMYATPVLALGIIYLMFFLRKLLSLKYSKSCYVQRLPWYGTALVLLLMIYNIFSYNSNAMMGLQFYSKDISTLKTLSKSLKKEDTIISWWDYGWPLWYYTGYNNTLADNGYHGGPDMHLIAQMLLSDDPYFVANASRYLGRYRPLSRTVSADYSLPKLAKDHNLTKLFNSFHQPAKIVLPEENGNVYIILHQNMLSYFGIIRQYASWDLTKKSIYRGMPKYLSTSIIRPFSHNYSLLEGYSYIFDSSNGMLVDAEGNQSAVNMLMIARKNRRKESFSFHNSSNINLLDAKGLLLWMDKKAYNGFYIQAMLLDVYDHKLFEKVGETGRIKIFKIKKPGE